MTSQDVLSAGGRAGRNPPREMTSSPGQFPAIRTSSPGTSRGGRTAGGAIAPATLPDDGSSQSTISRWVSQGAELLCTCIMVPNFAPMPAAAPLTPAARRFAIRLPRPRWIGVAAVAHDIVAVGVHCGLSIFRQEVVVREIERAEGLVGKAERGPLWLRNKFGRDNSPAFDDALFRASLVTTFMT